MLILTQIAKLSRTKDHYMTCAGSAFVIYCIVPKQIFTTPTTRHDYIDNKAKKIGRIVLRNIWLRFLLTCNFYVFVSY